MILKPMPDDTVCEVHDWPSDCLPERIFGEIGLRGTGGLNACADCLVKARNIAKKRLPRPGTPMTASFGLPRIGIVVVEGGFIGMVAL